MKVDRVGEEERRVQPVSLSLLWTTTDEYFGWFSLCLNQDLKTDHFTITTCAITV